MMYSAPVEQQQPKKESNPACRFCCICLLTVFIIIAFLFTFATLSHATKYGEYFPGEQLKAAGWQACGS